MALERPVNGVEARQRRVLLLPLAVEHLDGNGRVRSGLAPRCSCSCSGVSLRGTPRSERPLGCKAAKPPRSWAYHQSSERAHGHRLGWNPRGSASAEDEATVSRAILSGTVLRQELLDFADETKTRQGHRLGPDDWMILSSCAPLCTGLGASEKPTLVWGWSPYPRAGTRPGQSAALRAANAGSGNPPTARCCGFEPGTPKWRPVFPWPGASVSTGAPPRKSRSESTGQRLLLRWRLWSGIESKPDADILLRAGQAADRVLTRSPPAH